MDSGPKTTVGTPQGSVISTLLANIYLHYVLDLWAAHWQRTQARCQMFLVRYADDFVVGFQWKPETFDFLGLHLASAKPAKSFQMVRHTRGKMFQAKH